MDKPNHNHTPNNKDEKIRVNLLSSSQLDGFIKNLSNPRFLGSIHMNRESMEGNTSVNKLVKGNLENKLNSSIKNSIFNPVTKTLILLTILFNILWFTFSYLF